MRYGIINLEVIQAAIKFAKQEGLLVSLDLASFEVQVFLFQCFPSYIISVLPLTFYFLVVSNLRSVCTYVVSDVIQMVRNYKSPLLQLLGSGNIDLCFANEDEATELLR